MARACRGSQGGDQPKAFMAQADGEGAADLIRQMVAFGIDEASAAKLVKDHRGKIFPNIPIFHLDTEESESRDAFICDCGSSRHICNNLSYFTPSSLIATRVGVTVGSGEKIWAEKMGDVPLRTPGPGSGERFFFPSCPKHLISESQLVREGCQTKKAEGCVVISGKEGDTLMSGRLGDDNLFQLEVVPDTISYPGIFCQSRRPGTFNANGATSKLRRHALWRVSNVPAGWATGNV